MRTMSIVRAKKIIALFLMIAMTMSMMPTAFASQMTITVQIDGRPVQFQDQQPIIRDGRTLVPVRGVFEALGFEVFWDNPTATLQSDDTVLSISVGSNSFGANGASKPLDVPATLVNGRTMLPIRLPLEAAGFNMVWDASSQTVAITTDGTTPAVPTPVAANTSDEVHLTLTSPPGVQFFEPHLPAEEAFPNLWEGVVAELIDGDGTVLPLTITESVSTIWFTSGVSSLEQGMSFILRLSGLNELVVAVHAGDNRDIPVVNGVVEAPFTVGVEVVGDEEYAWELITGSAPAPFIVNMVLRPGNYFIGVPGHDFLVTLANGVQRTAVSQGSFAFMPPVSEAEAGIVTFIPIIDEPMIDGITTITAGDQARIHVFSLNTSRGANILRERNS